MFLTNTIIKTLYHPIVSLVYSFILLKGTKHHFHFLFAFLTYYHSHILSYLLLNTDRVGVTALDD